MKYTIGLYEKAMPDTLSWKEKLALAKESGYDFVEISIDESDAKLARLDWTGAERAALINDMLEVGLPIRSMCLSGHRKFPLGSNDPAVRERSLEIAQKAVDLASDLGVRIIQLAGYDVYYEDSNEDTLRFFAENLAKMVEMASAKGILLGFETMETEFMDTVTKAMKYCDLLNSPYLGVYPDCGNLNNAALKYGHDILDDLERGRGHIVAMHLKETEPGKYRNMLFGQGLVDFDKVVKKALDLKINRFVTEFWYLGGENFNEEIAQQNKIMRKQLDRFYK